MFSNKFKLIVKIIKQPNLNKRQTYTMWRVEDNRLATFTRICDEIAEERSYLNKALILQDFLRKGCNKKEFQGDTLLWVRMLIPGDSQRVYNLKNKQMVKLFSRLFCCDAHEMHLDLEQGGDISETVRKFFESSAKLKPQQNSVLYLQEVEQFLEKLEQRTKEDEQTDLLKELCQQSTSADLKTVIRLIKQDLRMNAKASHVLAAFGPLAYASYQATRDLAEVVRQFSFKNKNTVKTAENIIRTKAVNSKKGKLVNVHVMTPISPMLANVCSSVEDAFKKSPSGLFSEIKYDGERVQIHKQGNEFKFFSRNLKPVMDHKVKRFKEFIPKAFPGAGDMILDSEIILVDTVTGDLLPFGSLGAHKKKEYANAEVCLFVFDCVLFQGEDLTSLAFRDRRKVLEDNITPIKSYVQLSESHFLKTKNELSLMMAKVLKANLEGVVLKDPLGTYQPGKRGWLKVKKDYLFGGRMADSADLVVLGASYGSGKKGGILSIFLMGCFDPRDRLWKTVTKVHTGLDDKTRLEVHDHLMKIMDRSDGKQTPSWLLCNKPLIPDFIAKDPKAMPVWEITGAEFTKSNEHTASGISIRFPRITRIRDDKSAEQANDLVLLENMYHASKNNVNVDLLIKGCNDEDNIDKTDIVKINSKINLLKTPTKTNKTENSISPTSSKKMIKAETNDTPSSSKKIKTETNDTPSSSKKIKTETPTSSSRKRQLERDSDNENQMKNIKKIKAEPIECNDKKSSRKQLTLDSVFKTLKEIKKEEPLLDEEIEENESNLFKNIIAYFDNIADERETFKKFKANGGTITTDPAKADIIFYKSYNVQINLSDCRNIYRRSCRHLNIEWIIDCLAKKKLLDYGLYAIIIK